MSQQSTTVEPLALWRLEGPVAVITLNRPEKLNTWSPEMGIQYMDLLEKAEADPAVRAIVLTGAGTVFCAGADISLLDSVAKEGRAPDLGSRRQSFPRTLSKPVIAAINGPCVGVGLVIAMACDLRFAADGVKLSTAYARRGLASEFGGEWILGRTLGPARALDVLLSARTLTAVEAHELGLLNRVYPPAELLDATLTYANDLAENCSPWAMATIKRQLYASLDSSITEAEDLAGRFMEESFSRADLREGVDSFLERRPPRFLPLPAG